MVVISCGPRGEQKPVVETAGASETVYDPVEQGRGHYVRYCASCHGSDGRGAGPVAEALKDAPTDITRMRTEAAGAFEVDYLIEVIRGLKDVRAHGTREMPESGASLDSRQKCGSGIPYRYGPFRHIRNEGHESPGGGPVTWLFIGNPFLK